MPVCLGTRGSSPRVTLCVSRHHCARGPRGRTGPGDQHSDLSSPPDPAVRALVDDALVHHDPVYKRG